MGDRGAHDVESKAPEDEAPVAQETEEAGGTKIKEGFETSRRRVWEGEDQAECTFSFVSFLLLLLADLGRRSCWDTPTMMLTVVRG